jgi:hypothetical protein
MKKTLLLCSLAICSLLAQAQFPYNGTITTTDPTFHRPDQGSPPTMLSAQGTNVYYQVVPYMVTATGLVTITCTSPNRDFDTYGFLYSAPGLDPLNPLTNVLLGDDDSGPGLNFALTYDFTTTGTYYIVVTTLKPTLTGSYTLTITEASPLPVRLISFTAEKNGNSKNLLKWVSSEEINILKYEIQHSSDGTSFKNIAGAAIDARNLATNSYYNYADNAPYQKLNFYRLKITDRSGSITFSTIAVINNGKNITAGVSIFPNPAVNFLNIQTSAGQNGKAAVSIISGAGQIVYKSDYTIASESIINLNVKNLSAGYYVVRIETANGETTTVPFAKH